MFLTLVRFVLLVPQLFVAFLMAHYAGNCKSLDTWLMALQIDEMKDMWDRDPLDFGTLPSMHVRLLLLFLSLLLRIWFSFMATGRALSS